MRSGAASGARVWALIFAFGFVLFAAPRADAQSGGAYTITSSTIDGGGATFSTGGVYSLGGTIGQPDASGPMTGGVYSVTGGFWAQVSSDLRGDADGNSTYSVLDVFFLINNLFAAGPSPATACRGDANADGVKSVLDVFYLINFLFAAGPPPAGC